MMKNKLFALLVFALLLIAIPAALAQNNDSNSENECEVNEDCGENEYCTTEFKCEDIEDESNDDDEIECTTDTDCDLDEFCDNGKCEDIDEEYEDDNKTDNETISNETKVMRNNLGSNIRLMMLEKSVTWAIMRGEVVVGYFEDNGKESTRMHEILERLSTIVSASRDIRESQDMSAEKYAELRVESVQLISEFKRLTWNNTNVEEREEIRKLLSELDDSPISELKEEIKTFIREYNAEKVKEIMEKLGERRAEIEQRIRDGDMTATEARERIREEYSKLTEEEREAAKLKLEEAIKQAKEIREKTLEQLKKETESKIRERIENRIRTTTDEKEILEEIKTRVRQRRTR